MKKSVLALVALSLVLFLPSVGAVETVTGDQVVIDTPINDDLLVTGGTISINARIDGDVIAAGGIIDINAPITGDLIAVGGQIQVKSDIGGKIIAAGGTISVRGAVETVIAAGGAIEFTSSAVVENYVIAAAGSLSNAGEIGDDLLGSTETFENTGMVKGKVEVEKPPTPEAEMKTVFSFLTVLSRIGYFLLGLVFIKWFGALFGTIQKEVKESWPKKLVVGFISILVTFVLLLILLVSVVGIPVATILTMFFVMAMMVAGIIVSYAFGEWLLKLIKVEPHWIITFGLGFILVNLFFLIPIAGFFIRIIVVSLGFGAIIYTVKNNWGTISAPAP
ncbi:MAG: hypothetical protein HXS52_03205 [Theionarchaea archaeon]|nr:hypothetical protein [Theionarchaea archaeon]MBU7036915.1 hypothetical protein [Theionarchaea archaeon]